MEIRSIAHVDRDDNGRRVAELMALWDWCWGSDDQWLYCYSNDERIFSHDHGYYFPQENGGWSEPSLLDHVAEAHEMPFNDGVSPQALIGAAGRLADVTGQALVTLLGNVPAAWPIPDSDLEALGFFLLSRASEVADRLRRRAEALSP